MRANNIEISSIVILEDDIEVSQIIKKSLREFGFHNTNCFHTASAFRKRFHELSPDLCIIDLNLPDHDGMDIVRHIRSHHCGILILTSRIDVTQCVIGLEEGADDYVVKPFEPRELVARAKSIIRRCQKEPSHKLGTVSFDIWEFNLDTNRLLDDNGCAHSLSIMEADILKVFVANPNTIISRSLLSNDKSAWYNERSIDVRVSRLRKKLQGSNNGSEIIKTVYGGGYIFTATVNRR